MMPIADDLQALLDAYVAAYQVGDASACADMFAPDGELYSPYAAPAIGRAAIEETHRSWTAELPAQKSMTVTSAGSSGDLAWCLAAYSEGQDTGNGTSLSVFERPSGGRWLIRVCSLNSNDG